MLRRRVPVAGKRRQSVRECRAFLAVEMVVKHSVVTFGLAFGLRVSKVSTVTVSRKSPGRETQNCRHFWTCVWSSHLKSVEQSSLLDLRLVFASQQCQPSQGSGGSWSRNAEVSSLLDLRLVLASQQCQLSQGSGWSW